MAAKKVPVIEANFPGGNILVEDIRGNTIRLRQDTRDTEGWWFYWCFRIRNAAGTTVHFKFTNGAVLSSRGPAFSYDGLAWSWLNRDEARGTAFTFSFPATAGEVYFSMGMPYLERNLKFFLDKNRKSPFLRLETLCLSRHGRKVECLYAGCLDRQPQVRVLLVARHHACEMMASYVMEGVMRYLLSRSELAGWLRENVEFMFIPFVDKDGVEEGDSGKNRRPRDHNRDYSGQSIYPEVKTIREFVPEWSGEKLKFALDLHCPMLRGPRDEKIFQVGSRYPRVWQEQRKFGLILKKCSAGSLPYSPAFDIPFWVGWNSPQNYRGGESFCAWAGRIPGILYAGSLEVAYATADGAEVNQKTATLFGQRLGRAIAEYLKNSL
ncbi:MAG TPA: M14-type cytosolic carboxypeptidase [bacterium]|nr:M14-type cytosolic carboxypeptidase [bacterium]